MHYPAIASQRPRPQTAPSTAKPLVIAVEATRLAAEVRGIGRYVRALLPSMLAVRPGSRILLFVKPRDVTAVAATLAEDRALCHAVEVRPIGELRDATADVFWYPWNIISTTPRHGSVVATMHDVAPLALPDPRLRKWRKNWRWRKRYRDTAARASLLVVDSQFTAEEVHRTLGVPHELMRVVPLAADDSTAPPALGDAAVLERLKIARPFVLTVGAGDRRKNIALVERAMARVVERIPDVTLVLAGPRTHAQYAEAPPAAWSRTVGFITDDDLCALYRSASCLVMPSRYEGFGLPVLEAMGFGLPVVCANASSLPEVGGNAAAWVEPDDDEALAGILTRVLTDPGVAEEMRVAGLRHASNFSWEATARMTLAAFDEAIALVDRHHGPSWLARVRASLPARVALRVSRLGRAPASRALEIR
jgi:glycosyltransferase involved in cell wall biosynthesis